MPNARHPFQSSIESTVREDHGEEDLETEKDFSRGRTDEWHSRETIRMTRTSRKIATKSRCARRSRLDLWNSGAIRLGQRSLPLGRLSKQHQSIEQWYDRAERRISFQRILRRLESKFIQCGRNVRRQIGHCSRLFPRHSTDLHAVRRISFVGIDADWSWSRKRFVCPRSEDHCHHLYSCSIIQTLIPLLLLQNSDQQGRNRLKRRVMIGDQEYGLGKVFQYGASPLHSIGSTGHSDDRFRCPRPCASIALFVVQLEMQELGQFRARPAIERIPNHRCRIRRRSSIDQRGELQWDRRIRTYFLFLSGTSIFSLFLTLIDLTVHRESGRSRGYRRCWHVQTSVGLSGAEKLDFDHLQSVQLRFLSFLERPLIFLTRDMRRSVVTMSHARLALDIFGRANLFKRSVLSSLNHLYLIRHLFSAVSNWNRRSTFSPNDRRSCTCYRMKLLPAYERWVKACRRMIDPDDCRRRNVINRSFIEPWWWRVCPKWRISSWNSPDKNSKNIK